MIRVAGIRFKKAGKVYYFDPGEFDIEKGMGVIVETARGLEYGTMSDDIKEVEEKEIVPPLKKIIRIADDKDIQQYRENLKKKESDLLLCQEKVDKHKLDMKLVDVEHTFDNSKIIFYFTSDGRVDFRELVKDLAGIFKMRIELRQIGVRDEAKLIGGIGTCGKGLCCHSWLQEFEPVSIKMAKIQNLSLNPAKISGICGRLMCCLKYENDVYCELRRGMPEVGEKVKTPDGMGIVAESNIFESSVKVRLVLDEKAGENPEKLSPDLSVYGKQQIRRLGNKKQKDDSTEDIDPALLREIKELLED
ncbi:stage 0 sporulation family protein [Bacillota bacterium]